jgi:hypothetical protein
MYTCRFQTSLTSQTLFHTIPVGIPRLQYVALWFTSFSKATEEIRALCWYDEKTVLASSYYIQSCTHYFQRLTREDYKPSSINTTVVAFLRKIW